VPLRSDCEKLYQQGKYKECLALAEPSKLAGQPDSEQVDVLLLAARIKRELTDWQGTAELLERAKELSSKNADSLQDLEVSLVLNAVRARLAPDRLTAKKLVHQSESLFNKVKSLDRGQKDYDRLFLTALCELGMAKIFATEVHLAAQNIRVACGFANEKFGAESVETIYPSLCMAIVHAREDQHTLSLAMAKNATQVARANYGRHPILIQPLFRLAQACIRRKLFAQALEHCRHLEGPIEQFIGEESDIYLDVLGMKTAAFDFLVDFTSAEFTASRRLKLMEKMRGKNSPKLIDPLCDLAQIVARRGDKEQAEKYFERALELVSELMRNNGFPEKEAALVATGKKEEPKFDDLQTSTMGTRVSGSSLVHLEYELTERLSDCYVWQGKIADVAKMIPASYRYAHTCRLDGIASMVTSINEYLLERARNLEPPDLDPPDND